MKQTFKIGDCVNFNTAQDRIQQGVVKIVSGGKICVLSHGYISALWPEQLTLITDEGEALLTKLEN